MHGKSLNVSHVLMAVDPAYPHWRDAIELAEALADQGVRTTLACVREPSMPFAARAKRIHGLSLRVEGASANGVNDPQDWLLFLEMLTQPDLVQIFMPEHAELIWRAPTVLRITDYHLSTVTRTLIGAMVMTHLLVVDAESKLEKLRSLGSELTYAAVIPHDKNLGRNYLLAYQETVQAAAMDIPREIPDRFELI